MSDETKKLELVTFPREAVLTTEQVALGLNVSPRTVERSGIPKSYIGPSRCVRYVWGAVLDHLTENAA